MSTIQKILSRSYGVLSPVVVSAGDLTRSYGVLSPAVVSAGDLTRSYGVLSPAMSSPTCTVLSAADLERCRLISTFKTGVVEVAVTNVQAGLFGVGSAFVIDREGYLLSCAHNFSRMKLKELCLANSIIVKSIGGLPRIERAELIALAPSYDLALLKVSPSYVKDSHVFEFCEPMEVGSSVFCLGNTLDVCNSMRGGIVSTPPLPWSQFTEGFKKKAASLVPDELLVPEDYKLIELDLRCSPGFSGTPAFNVIGRTMGIIKGGTIWSTFCIPSEIAQDFLRKYRDGKMASIELDGKNIYFMH